MVDTSVWVSVERGALTHTRVADLVDNDAVYLAPPVLAELEYGVRRASTEAQRNRRISALDRIRKKPCLLIDKDTGETFGRIAAGLDTAGRPAAHRVNDLWIAAVALQNGFRVLTENPGDFRDIPGLDVVAVT